MNNTGHQNNTWKDDPNGLKNAIIGIILILLLTLIYFYLLMTPPVSDLGLMTLLLTTTAGISALVGFLVYRFGWMEYFPTVRWALLAGYVFSGILTFFNVFVTAQLMFTDEHDLLLATVLLVFATGIAAVIGFYLSNTIVDRVFRIRRSATRVADGDFGVRINITGRDELAQLAQTFNEMSQKLETAENKQKEADDLRRELIAWVSHDLQTPLSSIQAMVEAMADGLVTDKLTSQRYLSNIQWEVQSLSNLIDDLFQLAQFDAGGLKLDIVSDSLVDLSNDVISSLSELASKKNIQLKSLIDEHMDLVPMDTLRIGRVLNNLISNAIYHTPEGGIIQLEAIKMANNIKVIVSDTGKGIDKKDLPFIFDRFFRGEKSRNRSTGGAGLGLAIAKGIVNSHHGDIYAESELGKGTKIIFTLPIRS